MTHPTTVPAGVPHQPSRAELEDLFTDTDTDWLPPAGHDSDPAAQAARERRRDYRLADLAGLRDGYYPDLDEDAS